MANAMQAEIKTVENSTLISGVGYDEATQTLVVRFKSNGSSYEYRGVPPATYRAMASAVSIGEYFSRHIKPNIQGKKLEQ